jgi:hypothetical protein
MIRECAATSPDAHLERVAEVAKAVGYDVDVAWVKSLIEAGASPAKGSPFKGLAKGTMKGCKGMTKGKSKGSPPAAGLEMLKALVAAGARYSEDDDKGVLNDTTEDITEMNRDAIDEHGEQPPEDVKVGLKAATEVLQQLILAKADVSNYKGKGKGVAEFFDLESERKERGKDCPPLKSVANMIRECASTSPDTHVELVAEVAKALGYDMDEYAGVK